MILIPKHRDLVVPLRLRTRIAGFYKLEAVDLSGRRRRLLADWFPNLITTSGANQLGTGTNYLTYCSVGSGNNAPNIADTQLQTRIATTGTVNSTTYSAQSGSPYYGTTTRQYAFAIGAAAGNLSEVGIGSDAGGLALFSRALILDGFGSPTTITVLSSEALYVTYQVNQYVPLTDIVNTVVIGGVTYNYTLRAANATAAATWALQNSDSPGIIQATVYNGALGAITGSPSGTSANSTSNANGSYSTGSFTLSGTSTWGLTNGNLSGGITAAQVQFGTTNNSRGAYQVSFSPAIPKDSSHVLTLSFSNSWAINTP